NPATQIRFTAEQRGDVRLGLYDLNGRLLRELFEGEVNAGETQLVRVEAGDLPSGTYVVRLDNGNDQASQRILLVK
ncbi:MAG: T9SS type A sorting domain-containing protein, partial [Bacteroidota bacterium]